MNRNSVLKHKQTYSNNNDYLFFIK